jgi:hypothetical protein
VTGLADHVLIQNVASRAGPGGVCGSQAMGANTMRRRDQSDDRQAIPGAPASAPGQAQQVGALMAAIEASLASLQGDDVPEETKRFLESCRQITCRG